LIERGLERQLRARMRPRLSTDDANALFGPTGSFGTMASKIRAAYCFGIIGSIVRHDLAIINDIRNVFAHTPHNVTLRNKRLQERIKNVVLLSVIWRQLNETPKMLLSFEEGYELTVTGAFLLTVGIYGTLLSHDKPKSLFFESKSSYYGFGLKVLLS